MKLARVLAGFLLIFLVNLYAFAGFNEEIVGARPQGMGGAFTAVADDSNALYYNPAGITDLKKHEVTMMHARKYDMTVGPDIDSNYIGIATKKMKYGHYGLSFLNQKVNGIAEEQIWAGTYAIKLLKNIAFGANLKWLVYKLAGTQQTSDPAIKDQSTTSADIGFKMKVKNNVNIGILIRNLFGELGRIKKESLDKTVKVGIAYEPFENLTLALDANAKDKIEDKDERKIQIAAGLEYRPGSHIVLRSGVNKSELTAGLGFAARNIQLDYAYMRNEDLGDTHRVSSSLRFGKESRINVKKVEGKPLPLHQKVKPLAQEKDMSGINNEKPVDMSNLIVLEDKKVVAHKKSSGKQTVKKTPKAKKAAENAELESYIKRIDNLLERISNKSSVSIKKAEIKESKEHDSYKEVKFIESTELEKFIKKDKLYYIIKKYKTRTDPFKKVDILAKKVLKGVRK